MVYLIHNGIPHCSFGLQFSNSDVEHLFMCLLCCLCLWGNACLILCPFFDWVFFYVELFVCFGD